MIPATVSNTFGQGRKTVRRTGDDRANHNAEQPRHTHHCIPAPEALLSLKAGTVLAANAYGVARLKHCIFCICRSRWAVVNQSLKRFQTELANS